MEQITLTEAERATARRRFKRHHFRRWTRELHQLAHEVRQNPRQKPELSAHVQLRIDALALARAAVEGRTFEPVTTAPYPCRAYLPVLAMTIKSDLKNLGLPATVRKAVLAWVRSLGRQQGRA